MDGRKSHITKIIFPSEIMCDCVEKRTVKRPNAKATVIGVTTVGTGGDWSPNF